jgi:hypothetical protein
MSIEMTGRLYRPSLAGRLSLARSARLLPLELRRSAMLWLLPPAVVLFAFDTYRSTVSMLPYWDLRAVAIQSHAVLDFAPFVAGAGAWMGSRDGRRHTIELVGTTAVPRWAALLTTWTAATCCAEAAYLACVGAAYLATVRQQAWGGPLWWPVAVGAASVAAFCAVGFAAGVLIPSRFTAPLVAAVAPVLLIATINPPGNTTYALVSPENSTARLNFFPDVGIFYPYLSDVAIVEVMFLAGLAATAIGVLGLPAGACGQRARGLAAVLALAGTAAAGTAVGLAGTARLDAHGMFAIPALNDAASDQPIPYTPVCSHSAIPVCLHPAFRAYLPDVTAALEPVLTQVAGLPGAPVRVEQVATPFYLNDTGYQTPGTESVGGAPAVLRLPLGSFLPGPVPFAGALRSVAGPGIVTSVIDGPDVRPASMARRAGPPGQRSAVQQSAAQQAVEAALLKASGLPLLPASAFDGGNAPAVGVPGPSPGTPVYAAAMRFAALTAAARHAWLATHLTALRSGHLPLAAIP